MTRVYFVLSLLVAWAGGAWAAELRCVVCATEIQGKYYWITSAAMAEKQSICETCNRLTNRCTICQLPVNHLGRALPDGRILCPADFQAAVLDERDALRIYEQARKDLAGILAGTGVIPGANIKVSLVDATRLRTLNQTLPTAHDDSNVLGLTRTRVRNKTEFEHEIYLVSGLGPARLAAISAHEFTHAWIHENVPITRRLERDSVEGFCELVAYKLMTQRGEPVEKKIILANAYTRGQVNAFVQAENTHQFERVVKWMKTGADDSIVTNATKQLAIRAEPVAPLWPVPRQVPTTVPNYLELRGVSGRPDRRFALINNATVVAGETARIRVADTSVVVRCLEVREKSVLLQLPDRPRPVELFLRKPIVTVDFAGEGDGEPRSGGRP